MRTLAISKVLVMAGLALLSSVCLADSSGVDSGYARRFSCDAPKLTAADSPAESGFGLDLAKAASDISAASVNRSYDIPGSDIRVMFSLRAAGGRIELSDAFQKRSGKGWELLLVFGAPTVFDNSTAENTLYVIKGGSDDGSIPPYEVECQLTRTRIATDCANCSSK